MRDPLVLLQRLAQEPATFDFYAALRQVECAYPAKARIGQALRPADEALRFGQHLSLGFEPNMLASLQVRDDGAAPLLRINFFGLLTANGPLPIHLTEYIRGRQHHMNDSTLARFLDLFHHRMISLFYRAWASAQPAVSLDRPDTDRFSDYLSSLIGIGMPALHEHDPVLDIAKRRHAGQLAAQCRNAAGLAATLNDFFQVPVQVQEFVGHWMALPADGLCRLRSGPRAETLGMTTVLGQKCWNAQHKFRLVLGPLTLPQARRFLPGGQSMQRLQAWVRQYAGLALDWDVNLVITKAQVPALRLGQDSQLGWTTWLGKAPLIADDRQLFIRSSEKA